MNIDLLKQELLRYEGYSSVVYLDSLGKPTCGIGHLLRPSDNLQVGIILTPQQIDSFFQQDIANAVKIVDSLKLNLDEVRYRVLVNLCFNLGNKITQFVHFLGACRVGDWATASAQLRSSTWFSQVGHRGPETCYAILNGRYEWESK